MGLREGWGAALGLAVKPWASFSLRLFPHFLSGDNDTYTNTGHLGTSLAVQWLRLHLPGQGVWGGIPGRGARIPHTLWPKSQNIKHTHTHKNRSNIVTNPIKNSKKKKKKGHSITVIQMKIYSQSQVKSLKIGARELVELTMVAVVAWVLSQLVRLLT